MRTKEEVLARIKDVAEDDFLGFRREVLVTEGLTFEAARDAGFLKEDATGKGWNAPTDEFVRRAAQDYLVFAIEKCVDHRGISAGRSVNKMTEYLWLLGEDELLAEFEAASYPQYGAPKLDVLVKAWGVEHVYVDDDAWNRMRQGLVCDPEGCPDMGCGA